MKKILIEVMIGVLVAVIVAVLHFGFDMFSTKTTSANK